MRKNLSIEVDYTHQNPTSLPQSVRSLFLILSFLSTGILSLSGQSQINGEKINKEISYVFKAPPKKSLKKEGSTALGNNNSPLPQNHNALINKLIDLNTQNDYQRIQTELFSPESFSQLLVESPQLIAEFFSILSDHQYNSTLGSLTSASQDEICDPRESPGFTSYGKIKNYGDEENGLSFSYHKLFSQIEYKQLLYLYELRDVYESIFALQQVKISPLVSLSLSYFQNKHKNISSVFEKILSPVDNEKSINKALGRIKEGLKAYQGSRCNIPHDKYLLSGTISILESEDIISEEKRLAVLNLFGNIFSGPDLSNLVLIDIESCGEFCLSYILQRNSGSNHIRYAQYQKTGGELFSKIVDVLSPYQQKSKTIVGATSNGNFLNLKTIEELDAYNNYIRETQKNNNLDEIVQAITAHFDETKKLSDTEFYTLLPDVNKLSWTEKKILIEKLYKLSSIRAVCNPENAEKLVSLFSGATNADINTTKTAIMNISFLMNLLGMENSKMIQTTAEGLLPSIKRFVVFQTSDLGRARIKLEQALSNYKDGTLLIDLTNIYLGLEHTHSKLENSPLQAFYTALKEHGNTTALAPLFNFKKNQDPQVVVDSLPGGPSSSDSDIAVAQIHTSLSYLLTTGGWGSQTYDSNIGDRNSLTQQFIEYGHAYKASVGSGYHFHLRESGQQKYAELLEEITSLRIKYIENLIVSLSDNFFLESLIESGSPVDYSAIRNERKDELESLVNQLRQIRKTKRFYKENDGYIDNKKLIDGLFPSHNYRSYSHANHHNPEIKKKIEILKKELSAPSSAIKNKDGIITDYIHILLFEERNDESMSYNAHAPLLQEVNKNFRHHVLGKEIHKDFMLSTQTGNVADSLYQDFKILDAKRHDWNTFSHSPHHRQTMMNFFLSGDFDLSVGPKSMKPGSRQRTIQMEENRDFKKVVNYMLIHTRRDEESCIAYTKKMIESLRDARLIGPVSEHEKKIQIKEIEERLKKRFLILQGSKKKYDPHTNAEIKTLAQQYYQTQTQILFLQLFSQAGIRSLLEQHKVTIDAIIPSIDEYRDELGEKENIGLRYLLLAAKLNDASLWSKENINMLLSASKNVRNMIIEELPVEALMMLPGMRLAQIFQKMSQLGKYGKWGNALNNLHGGIISYIAYVGVKAQVTGAPMEKIANMKDGIIHVISHGIEKWFQKTAKQTTVQKNSNVLPLVSNRQGLIVRMLPEVSINVIEVGVSDMMGQPMTLSDFAQNIAFGIAFEGATGGWTQSSQKGVPMNVSVLDGGMKIEKGDHTFLDTELFKEKASEAGFSDPKNVIAFVDQKGRLFINMTIRKTLSGQEQISIMREELVHQNFIRFETPMIKSLISSFGSSPDRLQQARNYLASLGVDVEQMQEVNLINEIIADYCGRMAHTPPIVTLFDPWIRSLLDQHDLLYLADKDVYIGDIVQNASVNGDISMSAAASLVSKIKIESRRGNIFHAPREHTDFPHHKYPLVVLVDHSNGSATVRGTPIAPGIYVYQTETQAKIVCDHHNGTVSFVGSATSSSLLMDFLDKVIKNKRNPIFLDQQLDLKDKGELRVDGHRFDISQFDQEVSVSFDFDTQKQTVEVIVSDGSGNTSSQTFQPTVVSFVQASGKRLYHITHENSNKKRGPSFRNVQADSDEFITGLYASNPLLYYKKLRFKIDGKIVEYQHGDITRFLAECDDHRRSYNGRHQGDNAVIYSGMKNAEKLFVKKFMQLSFSTKDITGITGAKTRYPSLFNMLKRSRHYKFNKVTKISNASSCQKALEAIEKHIQSVQQDMLSVDDPDLVLFLQTQKDILESYHNSLSLAEETMFNNAQNGAVPFSVVININTGGINRETSNTPGETKAKASSSENIVYMNYLETLLGRITAFAEQYNNFGLVGIRGNNGELQDLSRQSGYDITAHSQPSPGGPDFSGEVLSGPQDIEGYGGNYPDYYEYPITTPDGLSFSILFIGAEKNIRHVQHETIVQTNGQHPYIVVEQRESGYLLTLGGNSSVTQQIDLEYFVNFLYFSSFTQHLSSIYYPDSSRPLTDFLQVSINLQNARNLGPTQQAVLQCYDHVYNFFQEYKKGDKASKPRLNLLKKSMAESISSFKLKYGDTAIPLGPRHSDRKMLIEELDNLEFAIIARNGYVFLIDNPFVQGFFGSEPMMEAASEPRFHHLFTHPN